MRPINIVLLVLAGAIGGAVVMRVMHRPEPQVASLTPASETTAVPEAADVPAAPAPVAATPAVTLPPMETQTPAETQAPAVSRPAAPLPPLETPAARKTRVKTARPAARPVPVQEKRPSPFYRQPETVATVQHKEVGPPPAERVAEHAASQPAAGGGAAEHATPEQAVAEPAAPPAAPEPVTPARRVENTTPPPAPPAPTPNTVTLNAGMLIPVRLLDGLSTERNLPGDAFTATLDKELVADGFVIAERGARVEGRVVSVDRGSKTRGGAAIAVVLDRLRTSDNQTVNIQTDSFEKRSEPNRTRDAEKVAGGAAIGAIIGAIAGGGKGAAIGAGAGGGVGAADVMLTRQPATLPSETRISFRLNKGVTLTEKMP